jgi:DNA modification methylase
MTVTAEINKPYLDSKHCKIYQGNATKILKERIAPKSIDMAICSPPYWGLRFYNTEPQIWGGDPNCDHDFQTRKYFLHSGRGDAQKSAKYSEQEHIPDRELQDATCSKCQAWLGELGLEPNPNMFIDHLIEIFDGVGYVLKDNSTVWVNFGDTYSGSGGNNTNCGYSRKGTGGSGEMGDGVYARLKKRASFQVRRFDTSGIPGKSLCMIPERFAMAMIERGWILRNKIIWHKPNVMPQSIKDRFTVDWEYLFFFTKQREYYFDTQYEPYQSTPKQLSSYMKTDYEGTSLKDYNSAGAQNPSDTKRRIITSMRRGRFGGDKAPGYNNDKYSGKAWEPNESAKGRIMRSVWTIPTEPNGDEHYASYPTKLCKTPILAGCPPGGTVLDPFCGTGATGEAALSLGRDFIGIDVSQKFCELTRKRLDKYIGQERLF